MNRWSCVYRQAHMCCFKCIDEPHREKKLCFCNLMRCFVVSLSHSAASQQTQHKHKFPIFFHFASNAHFFIAFEWRLQEKNWNKQSVTKKQTLYMRSKVNELTKRRKSVKKETIENRSCYFSKYHDFFSLVLSFSNVFWNLLLGISRIHHINQAKWTKKAHIVGEKKITRASLCFKIFMCLTNHWFMAATNLSAEGKYMVRDDEYGFYAIEERAFPNFKFWKKETSDWSTELNGNRSNLFR